MRSRTSLGRVRSTSIKEKAQKKDLPQVKNDNVPSSNSFDQGKQSWISFVSGNSIGHGNTRPELTGKLDGLISISTHTAKCF